MYSLLRYIPKNLLSQTVGKLASIKLGPLNDHLLKWYCKRYGVNTMEFVGGFSDYPSLSEFFIRPLRPGVRPIGEGFVSPCDGKIVECGTVSDGTLIQAKNFNYSVEALLSSAEDAKRYNSGYALTIYLAPGDYHRVHSPCDGSITSIRHIPGALWPVNQWSVSTIDRLFATNERIVINFSTSEGQVAMVMVGATNVGSIRLAFDEMRTNRFFQSKKVTDKALREPYSINRGDEVGYFAMGSTVILLFENELFRPNERCKLGHVALGESLGTVLQTSSSASVHGR